jgi:hypothetical protein
MQVALRPMNLGEILDRTFEIYRKKFLVFAGIAALPAAVMLGIHVVDIAWVHTDRLIGMEGEEQSTRMALNWLRSYGYYHISGFLAVLVQPAFVRATSKVLFDESTSILGSLRFIAKRSRTYLWLAFLKICAQLVVPELLAIGLFAGAGFGLDSIGMADNFFPLGGILILLIAALIFSFYWMGTSLAFAVPVAALEEIGAWKALRRSWNLTKGGRGRIFVAWVMVFACAMVLEGTVAFLAWWIATLVYTGRHYAGFNRQVYEVVIYFFYAVVGAVVRPLYPIAVTLFYYDQRSRKEGFDVEVMMEAAGLGTGEPGAIRNLRGGSAEIERAAEPLWPQIVKFIHSLRGFD